MPPVVGNISGDVMKTDQSGFTLLELMVAMALMVAIASFAVVGYTRHVDRGRITAAKACVLRYALADQPLNPQAGQTTAMMPTCVNQQSSWYQFRKLTASGATVYKAVPRVARISARACSTLQVDGLGDVTASPDDGSGCP